MGRKGKGRKFIDKKRDKVYSFKVVRRSQRDPLIADETAPQGVLVVADDGTQEKDIATNYGVYFDDDYDYLQHLRGVKEAIDWEDCDLEIYTIRKKDKKNKAKCENPGMLFPSSAFESYIEEPVGMLNKAAPVSGPQLDIDPDIVAELDRLELEDATEEIPDDFFVLMNSKDPIEGAEYEEDGCNSNIENWLRHTGDYEDITSCGDNLYRMQAVQPQEGKDNDEFIEQINKMSVSAIHKTHEDTDDDDSDNYEDIDDADADDEDSDFNVSDDDNDAKSQPRAHEEFVTKYALNGYHIRNISETDEQYNNYDPLGYGGNIQISDDEDESQDVLHKLMSRRKKCTDDKMSRTSRTSHSCSHLPRSELLSWLDERFEYMYENEYSKDQWGALDNEVIEGRINPNSEIFQQIMNKTKKQIQNMKQASYDDTDRDRIIEWIREGQILGKDYEKEEYEVVEVSNNEADTKYNCETVLQVRSKCSIQPAILDSPVPRKSRIQIDNKRGYPLLHEKSQLTKRALAQHDEDWEAKEDNEFETETLKSRLSLISYRPPYETPEDKRDRKNAVKELRRERRIERKFNKESFKEEKKKQIRDQMNIRNNKKISLV